MSVYHLDGYNVTADSREEALDLLLEYHNTGEPIKGVEEGDYMTEEELQESYDNGLNETWGTVNVAGHTYDTARALRELDPIAYRVGMADYADSLLRDDDALTIEGYSS